MYPSIADNASLCFNQVFLVRLLMPLCFNFLLISGLSDTSAGVDVQYGYVYRRNMDISVLFGSWFNRFLPILIPFLSAVVFFNLTSRMLSTVGIEIHDPNDVERVAVRQRIEDGRKLVEHELGYHLASVTLPGEEGDVQANHS
uniref:LMBR1 domain-containing protein 2 A n=1 Tax=Lygus hesperus TaxID=30085 RepID=A0A146M4I4_LYGHE